MATTTVTLPSELSSQFIQNVIGESFILKYANVVPGSTRGNFFVVDDDDGLGEFQQTRDDLKNETQENLGTLDIPATTIYKSIVIPNQSLQDDDVLYENIVNRVSKKIAVTVDSAIGAGAPVAPATFTTFFNKLIDVDVALDETGVDGIIDLFADMLQEGTEATAFWLSPYGKAAFMKMKKSNGDPALTTYTGANGGSVDYILGKPAFTNRWSASNASNYGYVGDWSRLVVPISNQIRIRPNQYSDRAFKHNATEFLVEMDIGCGCKDLKPFRHLRAAE